MAKVKRYTKKRKTTGRSRPSQRRKHKNIFSRIFVSTLIVLAFVALGYFLFHYFYPEYNDFENGSLARKYEVRGVDLSHHNEIISWGAIREKDVTFAYLKVTEGTCMQDKEYERNYRLAKENNIVVGTYHFFSFRTSGEEQARHFIRQAICKKGDLRPAIDVEHSPFNLYKKDKASRDKVVKELSVFEKRLRVYYGKYPVIYTNKECYDLYVKDNFPKNPIWICDLSKEPKNKIDNWVIWQFSHTGKIQGTRGHIDLNYYRYSFEEFKKLLL